MLLTRPNGSNTAFIIVSSMLLCKSDMYTLVGPKLAFFNFSFSSAILNNTKCLLKLLSR